MVQILYWLALIPALAIAAIGVGYLARPWWMTGRFGLPSPEPGRNTTWWLRLKGVRDVASGIAVLAVMASGTPRVVGVLLLADALIPIGDMLTILAAKGSARTAFGVHGSTAVAMVAIATPLTVLGG